MVAAKKKELEAKRGEKKAVLQKKIKEKAESQVKRTLERYDAALQRMTSLADKLDKRIAAIEGRGITLSNAKAKLSEARALISAAEGKVSEAASAGVEITEGATPKEAFETMRTFLGNVKESITAAHKALVEATTLVKAGTPEKDLNATTTESQ